MQGLLFNLVTFTYVIIDTVIVVLNMARQLASLTFHTLTVELQSDDNKISSESSTKDIILIL